MTDGTMGITWNVTCPGFLLNDVMHECMFYLNSQLRTTTSASRFFAHGLSPQASFFPFDNTQPNEDRMSLIGFQKAI